MMRQKKRLFLLIVTMVSLVLLTTPIFAETYSAHTVKKIWAENSASSKSESMEIQLLRDYSPYGKPVLLTGKNMWTYTWNELSDEFNWTVEGVNLPLDGSEHKVDFDGIIVTMGAFEDTSEENFDEALETEGNGHIDIVVYVTLAAGIVILMMKNKEKRRGH